MRILIVYVCIYVELLYIFLLYISSFFIFLSLRMHFDNQLVDYVNYVDLSIESELVNLGISVV